MRGKLIPRVENKNLNQVLGEREMDNLTAGVGSRSNPHRSWVGAIRAIIEFYFKLYFYLKKLTIL